MADGGVRGSDAAEEYALAARVIERATRLGVRIAVAESLTGGLLTAALVAVPGASAVLSGGIVAYDTELKATLLGVDRELLRTRGPVDAEVARQMATGVREACSVSGQAGVVSPADVGVSTTGVAGPDPDPQSGQPAGTVWLGVSSTGGVSAELLELSVSGRQEIRAAAVVGALRLLLKQLG